MTDSDDYFEYLRGRSRLGLWYRRHWLYPRLCRRLKGQDLLDVGCGIGDFLRYRPGAIGVDINPQTVQWCRREGLDARLMEPDVLPFDGTTFDGVMLDNVLEHLAEPGPLLGEIHRVLRPGGRVVVGVPGKRGYAGDPDHKVYYDEAALIACLSAAGFTCEAVMFMPFRSSWFDQCLRQYCIYGVAAVRLPEEVCR